MEYNKVCRAGIDIGSTTVKLVVTDDGGDILFGEYRRHHAHTQQTLAELLTEAKAVTGAFLLGAKSLLPTAAQTAATAVRAAILF